MMLRRIWQEPTRRLCRLSPPQRGLGEAGLWGRHWGATMREIIPFHPPWTDPCFAEVTSCGTRGMLLQLCSVTPVVSYGQEKKLGDHMGKKKPQNRFG